MSDNPLSVNEYAKGTCQFMCPEKERVMREKERLLHSFEVLDTNNCREKLKTVSKPRKKSEPNYHKADPNKAVKCFSRSAAGQKSPNPEDLRPAPVLFKTVDYLIRNIACRGLEGQWVERYNFVADRLRAVRQDMVIQRLPPEDSIRLLEPMVKFHIFAAYWLCENPVSEFDPTINRTFLIECIKRLLVMYDDHEPELSGHIFHEPNMRGRVCEDSARNQCQRGVLFCKNEEHLMEALYLIINLGDSHALMRSLLQERGCTTKFNTCVQDQAISMSLAWQCRNYVAVCRALQLLPPLMSMAAVLHLPEIHRYGSFWKLKPFPRAVWQSIYERQSDLKFKRKKEILDTQAMCLASGLEQALLVMNSAYSSKALQVPLTYLQDILLWPNTRHAINECSHYGIQCTTSDSESRVHFLKGNFYAEARLYASFRMPWLDEGVTPENLLRIFFL